MSKTSRKVSKIPNRRPKRRNNRIRKQIMTKNYQGSLSIHFSANQWRALPDISDGCYLCPIPTGYGVSLRGHDIAPVLEKGIAEITIYQPTAVQMKYRISVLEFLSPFTIPNVIYQPHYLSFLTEPCAIQNIFANTWLRPIDQTVQLFRVVSDVKILIDTSVGIDSVAKTIYVKIPRVTTHFTADDTTGAVTTLNAQVIFITTDAPGSNPLYAFDFAIDRKFLAQY
jgi:hypothetical protein